MYNRNNKLPNNLPQLQNLIKQYSLAYSEEFHQQYNHCRSNVEIFKLQPNKPSKELAEMLMFLAHIGHCARNITIAVLSNSEQLSNFLRS
jgi:protein SDA1